MKQLNFDDKFGGLLITQPSQSFTPRQILEQFARGEVVPSEYNPSDTIDDSTCSEEQMLNDVIEFEDAIDAENHLIENQYELQQERDPVPSGTASSPDEVTPGPGEGSSDPG